MSYCTECGYSLPINSFFCPNCGMKLGPNELRPEHESSATENTSSGTSFHAEKVQNQAWRAPEQQTEHIYGYQRQTLPPAPNRTTKKSGSATAIIVIASIVVVLAVLAFLILTLGGGKGTYVGYWESREVDTGNGYEDELYGNDIKGLIALQLNEDGTFQMHLSFSGVDDEFGTWTESKNGLILSFDDGSEELYYINKMLIMEFSGYDYRFVRTDGSIVGAGNEVSGGHNKGLQGNAISGHVGDSEFYVSITGAEHFLDIDNEPAIRVYYEFTNNSEYSCSSWYSLGWNAKQDGEYLEETYAWEDVDVYANDTCYIRPGMTIQCCVEFRYDEDDGSIELSFFGYDSGESGGVVTATYVPGVFPGAPPAISYAQIEDPEWTKKLESSGSFEDGAFDVAVVDAKLAEDYFGDAAIRVYYEFTNNSSAPVSMDMATYCYTYQDGFSMLPTYAMEDSETDENFYKEIAPGETIITSCLFTLRNSISNVEAEIESAVNHDAVGETYIIKK